MGLRQPLPQFDALRRRTTQRAEADVQQGQDAIKRRLASLGNLNAGAGIKLQQQSLDEGLRRKEDALQGVDMQEAQERQRLQEVQAQRNFAAQEAEKGRQFEAGQGDVARKFAATESQLGREFQGGETDKQRMFQKELFDKEAAFKDMVFKAEQGSRLDQLTLAKQEFKRDSISNYTNALTAALESGNPEAYADVLRQMNEAGDLGQNPAATLSSVPAKEGIASKVIKKAIPGYGVGVKVKEKLFGKKLFGKG